MSGQLHLFWWNCQNLFDDEDDPRTDDPVPSRREYHRDIKELASVIADVEPAPDLLGLAELENQAVAEELCQEMRWHANQRGYRCHDYIDSRDPRGIDVANLIRLDANCSIVGFAALRPADRAAVRPVLHLELDCSGRCLEIAFVHSKSKRSGPNLPEDATPGSRIRHAYGVLLGSLARKAASRGRGFIAMGDFNDAPACHALSDGAGAVLGRPRTTVERDRLYNLTLEAKNDSPGTHCYRGEWNYLDQVLVNGILLDEELWQVHRPHIHTEGPLLYKGRPNRWYSDHLPLSLRLDLRGEGLGQA